MPINEGDFWLPTRGYLSTPDNFTWKFFRSTLTPTHMVLMEWCNSNEDIKAAMAPKIGLTSLLAGEMDVPEDFL